MKLKTAILSLIFFLPVLFSPMAAAGEEVAKTGGVTIKSDALSYDQESDTYRATGNVQIVWDEVTLTADSVSLSEAGNEAVAEGKVSLVKGGDVLHSDRIRINLLTELGEVTNGDLFSRKTNFYLRGKKMMKVGKDDYRLENGTFTSCDADPPSWKFTASDLDVTMEGFARGWNAVFYIKDVPVFYTPYMLFPAKSERQSGLLFPRIGSTTKKGFIFDIH